MMYDMSKIDKKYETKLKSPLTFYPNTDELVFFSFTIFVLILSHQVLLESINETVGVQQTHFIYVRSVRFNAQRNFN